MKTSSFRHAARPRSWLVTVLLAAAAIAYVVFVFLPRQRDIELLRAQLEQRRDQLAQAQTLAPTLAEARQRLSETRAASRQWREAAPKHGQLVAHFASLTQQAEQAGVAIGRLDPLAPVELQLITQQNVTLQVQGSFAAVFHLLQRLEALPGTLWIRNLRLQASGEGVNLLRGELTLTILADRSDYAD